MKREDQFITVNQALNLSPSFGPIPGEQLVPWVLILLFSYVIVHRVFSVALLPSALVALWGCVSWWCLTGDKGWRFLNKFVNPPKWTRGQKPYFPLLASLATSNKKLLGNGGRNA